MNHGYDAMRVVIAGAASLLAKELKDVLEQSSLAAAEIQLLDEELAAGTLTSSGDEPVVIQTINDDSFERARFVFFAGSPGFAEKYAPQAERSGALMIDLSGGLTSRTQARPWIAALDAALPAPPSHLAAGSVQSFYSIPSVTADIAISLSAALAPLGLSRLVITALQPVSEHGREAIEELENQVVNLLSFKPIGQTVFDAQVGFNLLTSFGEQSSFKLSDARARTVAETRRYLDGRLAMPAIALMQAPVFHSHGFTAFAEFASAPVLAEITHRLQQAGLKVAAQDDEPPNNVNVVEQSRPVVGQPQRDPGIENGVWLFGAADNLRVPAANAVALAEKLLAS
jgi:aspartate-semialdehyde dehydrogenase